MYHEVSFGVLKRTSAEVMRTDSSLTFAHETTQSAVLYNHKSEAP